MHYICCISEGIEHTGAFKIVGTRMGELSFIGPFKYTSVVLAIILGYLIWDEAPTPLMLTGVAVIVLSGIALLAGEKRRLRRKLVITPLS